MSEKNEGAGAHGEGRDTPSNPGARVKLQEVVEAMDAGGDLELTWYVDRVTGEVVLDADGVDDEDLPVSREELRGSARFVCIPADETHDAYEDMQAFIETVQDDELARLLSNAIAGKGAFRGFKDVLLSVPKERERWFAFQAQRVEQRAREWLEAEGIPYDERESQPG